MTSSSLTRRIFGLCAILLAVAQLTPTVAELLSWLWHQFGGP